MKSDGNSSQIPISNQDGHQAKNRKKGMKFKKKSSLPILCPAFQTSDQDGRHSQT
jgi:hypothetical protein